MVTLEDGSGNDKKLDISADTISSPKPRTNPIHKSHSLINLPSAINTKARIRFSVDDGLTRSPILNDADHLYSSGLRRIRQQQVPLSPINPSAGPSWSVPGSRVGSISLGPSSPHLGSCEDLARFPSESLHSFSFAHQSEDLIHSRQNILKRSIEFMRDKLGWAAQSPMITSAQAKVEGDEEMLHMMELLQRANLMGTDARSILSGPLTGPATNHGDKNPFDGSFGDAPGTSPPRSPMTVKKMPLSAEPAEMDPNESLLKSEGSSRTTTNESLSTNHTSPPPTRRGSLKRTYTDTSPLNLQTKLLEALAQPYLAGDASLAAGSNMLSATTALGAVRAGNNVVHNHSNRYAPASQAIFTTEANFPWTILAANDLACLVFGVTKAEVRRIGILEVVKEERREWLASKLRHPDQKKSMSRPDTLTPTLTGIQRVLSKSKASKAAAATRRARTEVAPVENVKHIGGSASHHHDKTKSRGVILCGDVVPIQKRNGNVGAASLWVKEKKGGLIWVLEEINEDLVFLYVGGNDSKVTRKEQDSTNVFGEREIVGVEVSKLLPHLPLLDSGRVDFNTMGHCMQLTASHGIGVSVPCAVEAIPEQNGLRISSFPHIAGIIVVSAKTLLIQSSNTVFSSALFGQSKPAGLHINELIPLFDKMIKLLEEEDKVLLVDGIVVPEHSFRRARALLALREGKAGAAASFLRPSGLPAKHRDGGHLKIDTQMRVVTSESEVAIIDDVDRPDKSEVVYALWITYSRHLHAATETEADPTSAQYKRVIEEPTRQPSPGQSSTPIIQRMDSFQPKSEDTRTQNAALISKQLERVLAEEKTKPKPAEEEEDHKKSIKDFIILEDMGQGAYGQVKLARYRKDHNKRVVIKYVTKKRILVDTWTRDRKLGTVPLEIHVLDFLRREDLVHPNIVEMADFFEDDVNYYIEMVPHGLPGMDLFDYIELKVTMDEAECRSIFCQVARAIEHLHTKALVVHRDVKDENVVLDGEGKIKLIDFGSAAYIKNGPFDVFVGTVDYAAPEVLSGKSYRGKEQDVWALGVLLYTIIYKENPFYNIDEILDRDLRIPYILSDDSIDLIKNMLNRDAEKRSTITQVLEHPWCLSSANTVPPPLTTPAMEGNVATRSQKPYIFDE